MSQESYTACAQVRSITGDEIQVEVQVTLRGEPKIPDVDEMVARCVESVRSQMTDTPRGSGPKTGRCPEHFLTYCEECGYV